MKLAVYKNNQLVTSVELTSTEDHSEFFVGRAEDCHVRLNDPVLSRHHFVIVKNKNNWSLEKISNVGDLSVNGKEVTKFEIKSADRINFNIYTLVPEIDSSPASQSAIFDQDLTKYDVSSHEPVEEMSQTVVHQPVELESPSSQTDENFNEQSSEIMDFNHEEEVIGREMKLDENQEISPVLEENLTEDSSFEDSPSEETPYEDPSEKTAIYNTFARYELQLFGEYAPYDRYLIEDQDIFIGRDSNKCQIPLNDPEVSSVHAVIRKQLSTIILEDLNSSNGTLLKGQRINKAEVRNGDEFIIGSTTFTLKIRSDLLEVESDRLMPVDLNQVIEKEEIVEEEVDIGGLNNTGTDSFSNESPVEKSIVKRILKDPKKRMIAIVVVGLLLLLLLDEDSTNKEVVPKPEDVKPAVTKEEKKLDNKKVLSEEEQRNLEAMFKWAESLVAQGKLDDALAELEKIMIIDDTFNNVKTLYGAIKKKNEELKRKEEERAELARREKIKEEVKLLEVDAERAVKERNVKLAEEIFSQVLQKDPENIRIQTLKIELEGWQQEEARKASEIARKEADRKRMVDALKPGKNHYLKKEWHQAITELDKFLQSKGMDEDLVKEASEMLGDAKNNLNSEIAPILGKARSLKEGQDLKAAYDSYQEVLRMDPYHSESIMEMEGIREVLDNRAKKIYREAIIAESLSLFNDAKEKFLEVQQNSPTDSEYYKKATEKLKNYMD